MAGMSNIVSCLILLRCLTFYSFLMVSEVVIKEDSTKTLVLSKTVH